MTRNEGCDRARSARETEQRGVTTIPCSKHHFPRRLRSQPQEGTPGTNGLGVIKQGYLETSNVNVVQELVTMIQTQRAYEMNSKAISTSDQMLAKLSQL